MGQFLWFDDFLFEMLSQVPHGLGGVEVVVMDVLAGYLGETFSELDDEWVSVVYCRCVK